MKKIGSILLSIAALSLLGAIFSAGRDADTAGGRLVGALIVGSIGAVFMCVGNEGDKGEAIHQSQLLKKLIGICIRDLIPPKLIPLKL